MASILRRKLLLTDQPNGARKPQRDGVARPTDIVRVRKLIADSLGPQFLVRNCICGCGCSEQVHDHSLVERSINYICTERGKEKAVTAALCMIHEISICQSCFSQHRWGKPLTERFVVHVKEGLRNLDGWELHPPRPPISRSFGVVLDDEPPRYRSLNYESLRKVLGLPQNGPRINCRNYARGYSKGQYCFAHVHAGSSLCVNVQDLRMAILAEVPMIERLLQAVYYSTLCVSCKDRTNSSKVAVFVKQSLEQLANPAWLRFHALDQEPHDTDGGHLKGINSTTGMNRRLENYQMLAEIRQRLQGSEDPSFIRSFFKMAEELKSSLGRTGQGPGAPDKHSFGGGAGAA